jgi:hypothetical protein
MNGNGTNTQLSRVDQIESRIDKAAVGTIGVSAQRGMAVDSMGQAMEVAKLMSVSGCAVPRHLRGNPGACLAVAIQGWEWGINPFAIANKSYEVNDRLGYESALYQAVLNRRAPIKGRIQMAYSGEGANRRCKVWAELNEGGTAEYVSPPTGNITPKNSPLWKSDPDQQLFYFSVRSFARRHFADVMMGIATVDEMIDAPALDAPAQPARGAEAVLAKLTQRPVSEGQTFEPDPEAVARVEQAQAQEQPTEIEGEELPDVSDADTQPVDDARPTFTFPNPCTEAQMIGFATACAPEDMPPEKAEASFRGWLKLNAPKPWMKLSREEQKRIFELVTGGKFDWLPE